MKWWKRAIGEIEIWLPILYDYLRRKREKRKKENEEYEK